MKSDLSSVMAAPMRSKRSTPVVGWRFRPTHEELVTNYLKPKMLGHDHENSMISEVNFCRFDPWDLPNESKTKSNDNVWYFYCPRDLKYKKSRLSNRTTVGGYWKPTGKRIPVNAKSSKKQIGVKKTLVFYKGRSTKGVRTGWITHEYEWFGDSNLEIKGDYTLCKLKNKFEEKTCKGAPDDSQMALSSDCEGEPSDCMTNDYQNATGMVANSTCNASELSHLAFDNENHSSSLSTTNSACDESIPNHPTDFDLGGENSTETVVSSPCNDGDPDYNLLPDLENHAPNMLPAYYSRLMDHDSEDWISLSDIETSNPDFIIGSPYDKGEPCSRKAFDFGDQNQDNYHDISGCKEGDHISPAAVKTPPNKENDISIPVENSSSYLNSLLNSLLADDSLDGLSKISPEQLTELGAELKALIYLDSEINSINQPSCAPKEVPSAMAMDPFVSSGCLLWNSAIQ